VRMVAELIYHNAQNGVRRDLIFSLFGRAVPFALIDYHNAQNGVRRDLILNLFGRVAPFALVDPQHGGRGRYSITLSNRSENWRVF
jgi:hypothetical protein